MAKKKTFHVTFKRKTRYDKATDRFIPLFTWIMAHTEPVLSRYESNSNYHVISADMMFYDRMKFHAAELIVSGSDETEYSMMPSEMSSMIAKAEIRDGEIEGWWAYTKKCTSYSLVFLRPYDQSVDGLLTEAGLLTTKAWANGQMLS